MYYNKNNYKYCYCKQKNFRVKKLIAAIPNCDRIEFISRTLFTTLWTFVTGLFFLLTSTCYSFSKFNESQ